MKKIISFSAYLAVALLIFVTAGLYLLPRATEYINRTPCDLSIEYRIDQVDSRFGIEREEFTHSVKEAVGLWNDEVGRNIFVYSSDGELGVNLLFDKRQTISNEISALENELDETEKSLEPEIERYESLAVSYQSKLSALNEKILYWNGRGGAPKEEFEKLIDEQNQLKVEAEALSSLALRLNQSTNEYKETVSKLKSTSEIFKTALDIRPEQGIYNPRDQRVEIYLSNNDQELLHTLAHEFGHVIGISDHVEDENSIMYALNSESFELTENDKEALGVVCDKSIIKERIRVQLQRF